MAAARNADPARMSVLNQSSMRSLSYSRKRRRWFIDGAMSMDVPTAVQRNAAKYASRSVAVSALERACVNGSAEQEREQDLRPGQHDADLVEQLDELAVDALLVVLGHVSSGRRREESELAGSAGVTPAYVGLEPTLILPIDPPRPAIVQRARRGSAAPASEQRARRHDRDADGERLVDVAHAEGLLRRRREGRRHAGHGGDGLRRARRRRR